MTKEFKQEVPLHPFNLNVRGLIKTNFCSKDCLSFPSNCSSSAAKISFYKSPHFNPLKLNHSQINRKIIIFACNIFILTVYTK